jgi:hypothetical protein
VAEKGKNMPQKFCALGILWVSLGNAVREDLGSLAYASCPRQKYG